MRNRLVTAVIAVFCLLSTVPLRAEDPPKAPDAPAELKVANRSVIVFRATVLGEPPQSRVKGASAVIREALDEADDLTVSIDPIQNSYLVLLGVRRAFIVAPKDVDTQGAASTLETAEQAAQNLRLVVAETQEARSLRLILRALIAVTLATTLYLALLWVMVYLRRKMLMKLPELMDRHTKALSVGRVQLIDASFLYLLVSRVLWFLR
ncbi:mechanosensitive ion channel protein MscS, partial [Pseudomonas sp. MWU12-2312b]